MQMKFDVGLFVHILFERALRPDAFGYSSAEDGTRILRVSKRVEVSASASKLRRKEHGIGFGDVADGEEANALESRLGFGPHPPEPGDRKRSKPGFGVFYKKTASENGKPAGKPAEAQKVE